MQMKKPIDDLRSRVEENLTIPNADFGVAFMDLGSGESVLLNEKVNFHAASTMKTPVLIELYRQAANGNFSMDDSLEISNSFTSIADKTPYSLSAVDDSEQDLYQRLGEKETIKNLAYYMITRSSNLATNLLIERVGADNIMKTMKAIGAHDIKVLRGVEDNKAYRAGLNNTTTAYDLMLIFELLAAGKLANEASTLAMINILQDQEFNEIIPSRLPPDLKIAHKTGSITGVQHDSGIIYLPDGRKYVLVLLSKFEPADEKKIIEKMAEISRLFYDYMIDR